MLGSTTATTPTATSGWSRTERLSLISLLSRSTFFGETEIEADSSSSSWKLEPRQQRQKGDPPIKKFNKFIHFVKSFFQRRKNEKKKLSKKKERRVLNNFFLFLKSKKLSDELESKKWANAANLPSNNHKKISKSTFLITASSQSANELNHALSLIVISAEIRSSKY